MWRGALCEAVLKKRRDVKEPSPVRVGPLSPHEPGTSVRNTTIAAELEPRFELVDCSMCQQAYLWLMANGHSGSCCWYYERQTKGSVEILRYLKKTRPAKKTEAVKLALYTAQQISGLRIAHGSNFANLVEPP